MRNNGKKIEIQTSVRKKTKKFELLFEEISEALFLHDFDGSIIKANKSACECLGFTHEELSKMNIFTIGSTDLIHGYDDNFKRLVIEKRLRFETKHFTKNKKEIPVEVTSTIIIVDNKETILSSVRDISIRKNYENKLVEARKNAEDSEAELKAIFDNSPASIFLFDEQMHILRVNQKGLFQFQIKETDFQNKRLGDIINCINTKNRTIKCGSNGTCSTCKLNNIFNNTVTTGKSYTKEEVQIAIQVNGSVMEKTVLVSTSLLKRNGHSVLLATIDDVTKRKKLEQELILARDKAEESDRLKTAFIRNLSHEIRTPLNGILGFIDFFAEDNYQLPAERRMKFIEIIHKSGQRLINTVEQLVEISEMDSGILKLNEEPFYIKEVFDLFVMEQKQYFKNSKINFVYQIDPALKNQKIITDKLKLMQVAKHLLDNAFKFTSEGTVKLIIQNKNNNLTLSIEDTGIGIDSKFHQSIYNPFWQVENNTPHVYDGNGLGLTISKKLVASLGGELCIKSTLGKGSTFYFSLPGGIQVISTSVHLKPSNLENKSNLKGKTILIAEDELTNYLYLYAVLSNENCQLLHAFNGKEALDLVMQNPHIDLILMDLKMPVMDGFEATARIKEIRKNIPVIAQSAYVLNGEKERALETGCIDYLSKPLNKDELISVITQYLKYDE